MGCAECSGPLGPNGGKQAIFALGIFGHASCHQVCIACWKDIQELGGPGPNVRAQIGIRTGAAIGRARNGGRGW
jgi:hypothetical protein